MININISRMAILDDARRALWEGATLPSGLLPADVAESWKRSRDAGVSPWDKRLGVYFAIHDLSDSDLLLGKCAAPELERLWDVLGGSNWTLLCVNTQGVIVHAKNSQVTSPLDSLVVGARIQESDIGTTAPGCTIFGQQPVVIAGGEHYLKEFENFFCVSVPLFGLRGEFVGALDVTGIGSKNSGAVLEQLTVAAMAVESRLYASVKDCEIIAMQFDPRFIGTPYQGLLAIDSRGVVQAANGVARKILGLNGPLDAQGELRWDEVFQSSSNKVSGAPDLINLHAGASIYAQLLQSSKLPASFNLDVIPTVLGEDAVVNKMFGMASKAFAAGVPILLLGETGTGKEVFARALHEAHCPNAPFVAINCSAIPETLIEAELFGYVEGSFTGAKKGGAKGRLEEANGGTLLLDEIGDMPFLLQSRLLRVLQEKAVTKIGSSDRSSLDIRIVCATHCDVNQLIAEKHFREDLYYRINGLKVSLPPLRNRKDVHALIKRLCLALQGGALSAESLELLLNQKWPGNIRQLEQSIKLAVALAGPGVTLLPEHFPNLAILEDCRSSSLLKEYEKSKIQDALEANGGNVKATAEQLGIARGTVYRRLRSE